MVKIRKEDRDYLSYVFKKDGIIKDYRMTVAGFGVNAFPFMCTSIVKEHASKYLNIFPSAAKKLTEDMFIDDLVSGADTIEEASHLYLGPEVKKFCWSDSEIAFHWIKGNPARWKQFVSNRVKNIQSLTEPSEWRHCPGKENPADICSRGSSVKDLMESALVGRSLVA